MATTRRRYTGEFKREALRLAQQPEVSRVQVARELNVHPSLLRKWEVQFSSGRWEVKPRVALKSEQFKKSGGLLREGTLVKYGFMVRHQRIWPVRAMCRMLRVSHGGLSGGAGSAPQAPPAAAR